MRRGERKKERKGEQEQRDKRMGAVFAKLWNKFFNYAEFKVVIVGLDNAGKTTTLYKL